MDGINLRGKYFKLELEYPQSLLRGVSQISVMRNSYLYWQTFENSCGKKISYKNQKSEIADNQ